MIIDKIPEDISEKADISAGHAPVTASEARKTAEEVWLKHNGMELNTNTMDRIFSAIRSAAAAGKCWCDFTDTAYCFSVKHKAYLNRLGFRIERKDTSVYRIYWGFPPLG